MFLTIVSFLFVFTLITLVHEWGHLYFSKRAGIKVHEFGLGFGPTLWSTKKNQTTYKINLIPILGYVKIAGIDTDDPEELNTPESEKYFHKTVGQKFLSIFAGAMMNLILGFLIYTFIIMFTGVPAGVSNEIATIAPGSVASKLGLRPGDRLIAINGQEYKQPEEAVKFIHQSAGKNVQLTIVRGSETLKLSAIPELHKKLKIGLVGFSLKPLYNKVSPLQALYFGFRETIGLIMMLWLLIAKLFLGRLSVFDLAGPVGIAQITGQYAEQGLVSLFRFIAFFSINVAVLNLLPLPALDGGRLVFVLWEKIRGKAVSIEKENKVHAAGMYVFLGLFVLLTINDLLRIFK